jgi:hypothetical protein
MKYIFTIIIIHLLSFSIYGASIRFSGKILNNKQQELQFVNIGIINKTIGTVSDKNGSFTLIINENQLNNNDSIRFSMIGYHSKSYLVFDLLKNDSSTIILHERNIQIPEVVITSKKIKTKEKGTSHFPFPLYVGVYDSTTQDFNLGSAIARSFNITHKNTKLENIDFYIYSNFDTACIRINIYSVKNRKPHISLLAENICTDICGKTAGWVTVNLDPYNIYVDNDIILALEWVDKSKKGSYLFFPLARPSVASHYHKEGSQNK